MKRFAYFLAAGAILSAASLHAESSPAYVLVKSVPLGAPDRWDYVVADASAKRVYIAHGDRVTVIDADTGAVIGEVKGMPGGTHGIAISAATKQGFTDDGEKGEAVAFDLLTLKVTRRIAAADDADGIVREPVTGRILIVDGDPGTITVIDPKTNAVVATIRAGEKMEYAAADSRGHIYVAGETSSDVLKIDARTAKIVARWPTPGCEKPHGLAFDVVGKRVFMSCVNEKLVVVDATSGKVVATLPIGKGSDAVAFDPVRHRVFSSDGRDGRVSVYQQVTPNNYTAMAAIPTVVSARNMTVDERTGRLFVVGADTDPSATPGGRAHVRPGTTRVMIFDPIG